MLHKENKKLETCSHAFVSKYCWHLCFIHHFSTLKALLQDGLTCKLIKLQLKAYFISGSKWFKAFEKTGIFKMELEGICDYRIHSNNLAGKIIFCLFFFFLPANIEWVCVDLYNCRLPDLEKTPVLDPLTILPEVLLLPRSELL